jgi:hypothetical protein
MNDAVLAAAQWLYQHTREPAVLRRIALEDHPALAAVQNFNRTMREHEKHGD